MRTENANGQNEVVVGEYEGVGGTLRMIADVVMIEHNRDGERNDRTGN